VLLTTRRTKTSIDANSWIKSDLPELKDLYFAPDKAHALNDFHQPGLPLWPRAPPRHRVLYFITMLH
jgi:hypothetical protein